MNPQPTTASIAAPPTPPPVASVPAAPASDSQVNGLVTPRDQDGNVRTAEQMIYRAIELYVEGQGKPWPKDLNELVQAKVLQTIPPAPTGKKWAIDLEKHKVVLVTQ